MDANDVQQQSFLNATGVSMSDLGLVIAGLLVVAIMLWTAWVSLSYYEQWASQKNGVTFYDLIWASARGTILISLILYLVN